MSVTDLIQLFLSDVGTVAVLVVVLVAGARQYWVWGWTYQREVREKQEWRRIALANGQVADSALSQAKREPFSDREEDASW